MATQPAKSAQTAQTVQTSQTAQTVAKKSWPAIATQAETMTSQSAIGRSGEVEITAPQPIRLRALTTIPMIAAMWSTTSEPV